jgi:hypothetical protein
MLRRIVVRLLKRISRIETNYLYRRGKLDRANYLTRIAYPQTWWLWNRLPGPVGKKWFVYENHSYPNPLYRLLTALCGMLTGHDISRTEAGYGGGEYIDRHCRWCDKLFKEPIDDSDHAPLLLDLWNTPAEIDDSGLGV